MSLRPWLDDIKRIISSKQLTDAVTCTPVGSILIITDRLAGEYSVSADIIGGRDLLFTLPVGLPVSRSDPNFAKFVDYMRVIARDDKMILIDENRGGFRKYGVGVRFSWTNDLTGLSSLVDHNLSLQRRFFTLRADGIISKYIEWELDVISEEEFDKLVPDVDYS